MKRRPQTGLEGSFGKTVREMRLSSGLSQEQLAEAAGLHRNYVGLIERGVNSPSLSAIVSLAAALGISAAELVRRAERR